MSHIRLKQRTSAPATKAMLGLNLSMPHGYSDNITSNNLFPGDVWFSNGGAGLQQLPSANFDATTQYPSTLPATQTQFVTGLLNPVISEQYQMTWSGDITALTVSNSTGLDTSTLASHSAKFTPTNVEPAGTNNCAITITPGAVKPSNIKVLPVSASGVETFHAKFISNSNAISNSVVRLMKYGNVEANRHPTDYTTVKFPIDGDGQLSDKILTSTNRSTLSTGNWQGDTGDGWPFEQHVAVANALGRDLWFCINWNADDTYADAIFTYARDNLVGKLRVEVSNEVWNPTYTVFNQARNEGVAEGLSAVAGATISSITHSGTTATVTTSTAHGLSGTQNFATISGASPAAYNVTGATVTVTGTTTFTYTTATTPATNATSVGSYIVGDQNVARVLRYAEKAAAVFTRAEAIYGGALSTKLVRTIPWQNAGTSAFDYMRTLISAAWAKFDCLSSAPYFYCDSGNVTGGVPTGSIDLAAIFVAANTSVGETLTQAAAIKTYATLYGKSYACYEGGPSFYLSDPTTRDAAHQDSRMHDVCAYFISQFQSTIGTTSPICMFVDFEAAQSNHWFGMLAYTGQTISLANTPYAQAMKEAA